MPNSATRPRPCERGRDLHARGREAQVGDQSLHEPDAGAAAVDGGDEWLAQGARVGHRPVDALLTGDPLRACRQITGVESGAEPPARAR